MGQGTKDKLFSIRIPEKLLNTLSVNIKAGSFTLIPELRFESAQSGFYTKNDGSSSKSTATALLAAVYKF